MNAAPLLILSTLVFLVFAYALYRRVRRAPAQHEDPVEVLTRRILDMKELLIEAKKAAAVSIADEKRLEAQLDNELHQARSWKEKAMMALRADRDDLATEALRRKAEHDALAEEYRAQHEVQKASADALRERLRAFSETIERVKRQRTAMIMARRRAQAHEHVDETISSLTDVPDVDDLDVG